MTWYYADAGRQVGPVEEGALDDLVRSGVVRDDTLVWRDGMPNWQPHAAVRGARMAARSHARCSHRRRTGFCSECGRPFPHQSTGDDRQREPCARSASRCTCSAFAKAARPSESGTRRILDPFRGAGDRRSDSRHRAGDHHRSR